MVPFPRGRIIPERQQPLPGWTAYDEIRPGDYQTNVPYLTDRRKRARLPSLLCHEADKVLQRRVADRIEIQPPPKYPDARSV